MPLDLGIRLRLNELVPGRRFRFRLRANPCVTRAGKRFGLMQSVDQECWLLRQGERYGFTLHQSEREDFVGQPLSSPDVSIT